MSRSALRLPALVAVALVLVGGSAHAAVTRVLGPMTLFGEGRGFVKFDAAHDSINRVNLVVYGTQAFGPVNGMLLNESGAAVSGLFRISDFFRRPDGVVIDVQAGWARVTYAAQHGKFLVSYVKILGNGRHQRATRFIAVANNAPVLGPEIILDDWVGDAGTGTGLTYVPASGKFLVTWAHYYGSFPVSFVSVVDPAGNASAPIIVSDPADGESDPEIACDPLSRKCLIVGIAWGIKDGSGKSTFWGRFIDDATGAPLGPSSVYLLRFGGLMDPPAVVYSPATASNPSQFLIGLGFGGVIKGMIADGQSATFGLPFNMIQDTTNTQGVGYGFVSMRFNPQSQTTIASMTTWVGYAAVQELTGSGARTLNGFDLIPDTPESASRPWDTANQFAVAATNAVTGGFIALENHYFKVFRVSAFGGAPVTAPPVVTQHPQTANVRAGATVTFAASASGGPPPSVQWQVKVPGGTDFVNIAGGTGSSLVLTASRTENGKLFRAVFSNASGSATSAAAALLVMPPAANDIDGDGKSDQLVWRPSTGTWHWASSSVTNAPTLPSLLWGNASLGDVTLTGDLDGDAISDMVVWRPGGGTWLWLTSSTGYSSLAAGSLNWGDGTYGDIPMLADMDGDGLSDLVIWRPTDGTWNWLKSSTGFTQHGIKAWGTMGDIPRAGDFDGDGRADLAVWRPSEGMWYWLTSSTGYAYAAQTLKQWGAGFLGDKPFLADVDGDRRADLMVWRPTTGTWYWLTSSTGYQYSFAGGIQWGNAALGDIPVLNDFDGDGLADLGVWRESTGVWYWLPSSGGFTYATARSRLFGGSGDIPMVR